MNQAIKPTIQAYDRYVLVCVGDRCAGEGGGQAFYDELKAKLKQVSADNVSIKLKRSRVTCFGVCKAGPLLSVQPDGVWYYDIDSEKLDRIIEEHLIAGRPVTEWVFHQSPTCHAKG